MSELRRFLKANRLILALLFTGVVARLLMAWLLPPLVDIYYYDTEGARALLSGINPYGFTYSGIPQWLLTPGASNVFPYLPGVVLFLAPFGVLWDIRLGLILADIVMALSILVLGGDRAKKASLTFILLPLAAIFSTSYPNNTLVAIAFVGLAVAFWARGKGKAASVMMGIALASSQFIWILFPLFMAWTLRARRYGELVIQFATGLALIVPFAVWNWGAFITDTLTFEFSRAPRVLVTPVQFGYNVNPVLDGIVYTLTGMSVPLWLRSASVVIVVVLAALKSKDLPSLLRYSTIVMVFVIFVLPNVLSWWYFELPFATLLMWWVLRGRAPLATAANP